VEPRTGLSPAAAWRTSVKKISCCNSDVSLNKIKLKNKQTNKPIPLE
jgi:hypothetical protein